MIERREFLYREHCVFMRMLCSQLNVLAALFFSSWVCRCGRCSSLRHPMIFNSFSIFALFRRSPVHTRLWDSVPDSLSHSELKLNWVLRGFEFCVRFAKNNKRINPPAATRLFRNVVFFFSFFFQFVSFVRCFSKEKLVCGARAKRRDETRIPRTTKGTSVNLDETKIYP